MPRPHQEVGSDLLSVHGHYSYCVGTVVQEGNVIVFCNFGYSVNVMFVSKHVVEVVDHDQFRELSRLALN